MIIYSLLATPISNSISGKYGIELNSKRIEFGFKPITENWKLDSIVLQPPTRLSCFPSVKVDTTYRFLENKWYCQYWSNGTIDKTKPYHKNKKIYFTKSFWIWQTNLDFEVDLFVNPNSELGDYEELETRNFWWKYGYGEIYGNLNRWKNGEEVFVDFDLNQSAYGFEKNKVTDILEKWNLK